MGNLQTTPEAAIKQAEEDGTVGVSPPLLTLSFLFSAIHCRLPSLLKQCNGIFLQCVCLAGHRYPPISYMGTEPSAAAVPPGATTLDQATLVDKIKGVIYGNALGDAMGLATEFMTKVEAKQHYSQYTPYLPFDKFVRDMHRSRWPVGDWTGPYLKQENFSFALPTPLLTN